MAQNTISDELNRLIQAKADIKSALEEKGLTIGDSSTLDEYPALIQEMQTGGGSDTSVLIDLIEGDLETLIIPEGTTTLGRSDGKLGIKTIIFPSTLTTINTRALSFYKWDNLDLYIPNTIKTINNQAFYNSLIKSITFSDDCSINIQDNGVSQISNNTSSDPSVNKMVIKGKLLCGDRAFGYSKIKELVIDTSALIDNSYAQNGLFVNCRFNDITIKQANILYKNMFKGIRVKDGKIKILTNIDTLGNYAFNVENGYGPSEIVFKSALPTNIGNNVFDRITCPIYVPNRYLTDYQLNSSLSSYSAQFTPLASMNYDSTTYTVTALGRDNLELYVDASLINSSVYTFVPDDSSHIITVKSVDPSLGVLDEVSQEILVEEIDYSTQYFGLTGIQDASVGLTSSKTGGVDIKYSSDGENWTQWDYANETLNLPAGETLYFKGNNPNGFSGQSDSNSTFQLNNGNVSGHGNIQSLLYDDNFTNNNTIPSNYCYCLMFQNCTSLTTAQNLILPATTLTEGCYSAMFIRCTSLTTAPELPATTLVNVCYSGMFNGCTNLNYIKAMFTSIPDTSLAAWVSGVYSTGTFVMNPAAEWNPENYRGENGVPLYWTIEGWTPPAPAGQTFVKVTSADQLADGKKCIIVYDDVAMGSWKETETGNHDGDFVGVSVTAGNEIDISNTETPDPETPGWVLSIDVLTLEAISGNQYNLQYDNGNYVFSNRQGTSLTTSSNPFAWNITNQDNFGNNFNYFAIQHSITNSVYINSTGEAEEYCFNMTTGNPAMLYVEKTT